MKTCLSRLRNRDDWPHKGVGEGGYERRDKERFAAVRVFRRIAWLPADKIGSVEKSAGKPLVFDRRGMIRRLTSRRRVCKISRGLCVSSTKRKTMCARSLFIIEQHILDRRSRTPRYARNTRPPAWYMAVYELSVLGKHTITCVMVNEPAALLLIVSLFRRRIEMFIWRALVSANIESLSGNSHSVDLELARNAD